MRPFLCASLLAGLLLAGTSSASAHTVIEDRKLDLARAVSDPTQPRADFAFNARSDQVFTSAELQLAFGHADLSGIRGFEVLLNGERITQLQPKELTEGQEARIIALPARDLSDRNTLTLRMLTEDNAACSTVPPGIWDAIKSAQLTTQSSPLPLPNDLALLPLPFIDRGHDTEGVVPVVFASQPTPERIRIAGLIAGWLGMDVGLPMRFPVTIGELPDSSAIVFVDDPSAAAALGLPTPDGPKVRMIDHPAHPGSNVKLLVLEGRTPDELETVARNLATGTAPLAGQVVAFKDRPPVVPRAPYDAPRWLRDGVIPFAKYPNKPSLTYTGTSPGSIAVKFRVAPDLWSWPAEYVTLDLGYAEQLSGVAPPRLDVEFNGVFLATLPLLDPAHGQMTRRAEIRLRADQLRGYNELRVHVAYPGVDRCSAGTDQDASVSLSPDSALRLEKFGHFASLPDVSMFVHDGFPFTRVADLGDTAVVVPNTPLPQEIGTVLSTLAQFSRVTGVVGTRLTVMSADELLAQPGIDKDLLLVGLPSDHAVLRRWKDRMPLAFGATGAQVQMPVQSNPVLRFLSGRMGYSEMRHARQVVGATRSFSAVMGWQAPKRSNRSVVVLTATSAAALPAMSDVSGFADARTRDGDLLITSGNKRWMFRIGPSYDSGRLDDWTQARWTLATHWLALFPGLLIGSLIMGAGVRRGLDKRMRERFSGEEKQS